MSIINNFSKQKPSKKGLDKLNREFFIRKADKQLEKIIRNKKELIEEKHEFDLWNVTLNDGLSDF